jgi:hypothetical protein
MTVNAREWVRMALIGRFVAGELQYKATFLTTKGAKIAEIAAAMATGIGSLVPKFTQKRRNAEKYV